MRFPPGTTFLIFRLASSFIRISQAFCSLHQKVYSHQRFPPQLHLQSSRLVGFYLSKGLFSFSSTSIAARGRNKKQSSRGGGSSMRGVKKENLPLKVCVTCGRPFTWRKKWENCWDEVTTCSKSCNRKRREAKQKAKKEEFADKPNSDSLDNVPKEHNQSIQNMGDQINFENTFDGTLVSDIDSSTVEATEIEIDDPVARRKAERKAAKKARKAERRAQREGRGDPTAGQKECDMCGKSVDLLIRCKHAGSKAEYEMVCGSCWKVASGGVVDGDADHPDYQYGGLWKNRRKQAT